MKGGWSPAPALKASASLHVAATAALVAAPAAWPWLVGGLAANHLALTAVGLWPRSRLLGPNWLRLPPQPAAPRVVLTFDDGPDPLVTPALLDRLAELRLKAVFFCIAERARAHPALLRRIVEAGHEVQNHSLRHHHGFSLLGPAGLAREVGQAQRLLEDLSGRRPSAFRAPAGLRNALLDRELHRQGLHLVSWTRRGFDTRETDPARVLSRLTGRGLADGDILLLHDGHARRDASGRPVLWRVLPALAGRIASAGLGTGGLDEALPPRGLA